MTTYYLTTKLPRKILHLLHENNIEIPTHRTIPKVIEIPEVNDFLKYGCIDIIGSLNKIDIILLPQFGNPINPYVDTKMQNLVHLVLFYYCYNVNEDFEEFLENERSCKVPCGNMYQFGNGLAIKKALKRIEDVVGQRSNPVLSGHVLCDMDVIFKGFDLVIKLVGKQKI